MFVVVGLLEVVVAGGEGSAGEWVVARVRGVVECK